MRSHHLNLKSTPPNLVDARLPQKETTFHRLYGSVDTSLSARSISVPHAQNQEFLVALSTHPDRFVIAIYKHTHCHSHIHSSASRQPNSGLAIAPSSYLVLVLPTLYPVSFKARLRHSTGYGDSLLSLFLCYLHRIPSFLFATDSLFSVYDWSIQARSSQFLDQVLHGLLRIMGPAITATLETIPRSRQDAD